MQSQSRGTGAPNDVSQIELGWSVYDALGRPVGNVVDVEQGRGQLRIDGRPVGFDFYEVPLSSVKEVKNDDVYLSAQLDARSASSDQFPRWMSDADVASNAVTSTQRVSDAPRTTSPGGRSDTSASMHTSSAAPSASWSSTVEHPINANVVSTTSRDVPVWTEDDDERMSYVPWIAAVGVGAAGAAGYYWWLQHQRRTPYQRALDMASFAFDRAGTSLEPVYDRARTQPGWALGLAAAAALPLAAYLRGTGEETKVEKARGLFDEYNPFASTPTWRGSAATILDKTPAVRERAAALWEAAPSLATTRSTFRDYLTKEDQKDWYVWPIGAATLGMIVGALWYLLTRGDDAESSDRISDIMTRHPEVLRPDATVFEAASAMRRLDVGVIPVCDGTRLQGMVTDRDIALRSTADGRDPHLTLVSDVMTNDVRWAYEDESIEHASDLMRKHQIRRLPIVDRDKRLIGIVSLGDLAVDASDDRLSGSTLESVSKSDRSRR